MHHRDPHASACDVDGSSYALLLLALFGQACSDLPVPNRAEDARAEAQLRAFDLDSKFGGCIGLTRLERRALVEDQGHRITGAALALQWLQCHRMAAP